MTQAPPVRQAVSDGDLPEWPGTGWSAVPLTVLTDSGHGGRWTALSAGAHEWLWRNPDPGVVAARERVLPGAVFVDAGGVEECLPTVNGLPDHGAVWSRPWDSRGGHEVAMAGDLSLTRTMTVDDGGVSAAYSIAGPPGTPFVHAVHALLAVGTQARLVVPGPQSAVVLDGTRGGGGSAGTWPPIVAGVPADRLGPVDGTAALVLLPGCHRVVVVDGADALEMRWHVLDGPADDPADGPCSLLVWRNLGGWPVGEPYRSIGIEPMVGRTADSTAAPAPRRAGSAGTGAVGMPAAAVFRWQLHVRAWRFTHPH